MILASFTLWGEPKPKERPRFAKGRTFTSKTTLDAETAILDAFEHENPLFEPTIEDVTITVLFFRKSKRTADLDNLLKTVLDALNRVAYHDDKQVVELHAYRRDGMGDQASTVFKMELAS